jgi:hypothetical protein
MLMLNTPCLLADSLLGKSSNKVLFYLLFYKLTSSVLSWLLLLMSMAMLSLKEFFKLAIELSKNGLLLYYLSLNFFILSFLLHSSSIFSNSKDVCFIFIYFYCLCFLSEDKESSANNDPKPTLSFSTFTPENELLMSISSSYSNFNYFYLLDSFLCFLFLAFFFLLLFSFVIFMLLMRVFSD